MTAFTHVKFFSRVGERGQVVPFFYDNYLPLFISHSVRGMNAPL